MAEKGGNATTPRNGTWGRQSSILNRKFIVMAAILLLFPPAACTRSKVRNELQRNHFFAEILKREDRRELGEDGFFRNNLLGNPYPEVRQWCAVALGRIAAPQALPWLYEAVHAEYASVRAAAAFAIGEIEDRDLLQARGQLPNPRSSAELIGRLVDSSLAVRMRAIEALGKSGGPAEAAEIVRRLERFSYKGSRAERACLGYSITAMARLQDPVALPVLEKLAGSADREIRERAEAALARLRAGSGETSRKELMENSDPEPQAYGGRGLERVQGPSPEFPLPLRNSVSGDGVQKSPLPRPRITDTVAYALAADRKSSTIAILETTRGVIEIELSREHAPATAANFILQAEGGQLSGLEFVRPDPMILIARKPEGTPIRQSVRSEVNMLPFERGSVGMELSGGDSRADGFFITLAPQPYLDGIHTCIGRVISGIQVADKMVSGGRIERVRIKRTISYHNYRRY